MFLLFCHPSFYILSVNSCEVDLNYFSCQGTVTSSYNLLKWFLPSQMLLFFLYDAIRFVMSQLRPFTHKNTIWIWSTLSPSARLHSTLPYFIASSHPEGDSFTLEILTDCYFYVVILFSQQLELLTHGKISYSSYHWFAPTSHL